MDFSPRLSRGSREEFVGRVANRERESPRDTASRTAKRAAERCRRHLEDGDVIERSSGVSVRLREYSFNLTRTVVSAVGSGAGAIDGRGRASQLGAREAESTDGGPK